MASIVYKTDVTAHSSTANDLGEGLKPGHIRRDNEDGCEYILLEAAGAITNGDCVMHDAVDVATGLFTVVVTTGPTVSTVAVDNRGSATALADGDYFWGKCRGRGYIDPDATGWAVGAIITGGASGKGDVATQGTDSIFALALCGHDATDTLAGEALNHVWIFGI